MPLPVPNLDDLTFQAIVDHARKLIPLYCPEWTYHNVSDPGITMIELFASMSELLLYRVNQVPDKMYIAFLNLLGITLDAPRVASVPVTFYLAAAATEPITFDPEMLVSTLRTETREPIIFTTTKNFTVIQPQLIAVQSLRARQVEGNKWVTHTLIGDRFSSEAMLFDTKPATGDTLYLGLESDASDYVVDVETLVHRDRQGEALGIVRGQNPPQEWEASATGGIWLPCIVEHDTTTGFNFPGRIRLRLPAMEQTTVNDKAAFWLRCRLTNQQQADQKGSYSKSPHLQGLQVHAMGYTTTAEHAITVRNELLGISDGSPGQTFRLRHGPVLSAMGAEDHLIIQSREGEREDWKEVRDFSDSGPTNLHYILDRRTGLLSLGPVLPLPSGGVYRFGAVPLTGSRLIMQRYQYGGGTAGNVAVGTLTVLPQGHPKLRQVTNWVAGQDGLDEQNLEEAKLHAPRSLRTRDRAVTADDFEYLACAASPKVGRAHCFAPGEHSSGERAPEPGHVVVAIFPRVTEPMGYLPIDTLTPSQALLEIVEGELGKRLVIGVTLAVQPPAFLFVTVRSELRVAPAGGVGLRDAVLRRAEAALYRYLNPYVGGPEGKGWPFGRALYAAEVAGLLQQIPGVVQVVSVALVAEVAQAESDQIVITPNQVICSNKHTITSL